MAKQIKLFGPVLAACLSLVLLAGCATGGSGNTVSGSGESISFAQPFTDISIPPGFDMDRKQSFVYEAGSGVTKVGRLFYSGWANQGEVIAYYQNDMINRGWNLMNSMAHENKILNYEKQDWLCTMIISSSWGKVYIEMQVGPK